MLAQSMAEPARRLAAARAARVERLAAAAAALGQPSLGALGAELRGASPEALAALAEETLATTEPTWKALLAAAARAEGLAPEEVRLRNLPRLWRVRAPAALFPAHRHAADAAALLDGLGLDLAAQANLRLDTGAGGARVPRAIALAIDPPGDVRLSLGSEAGLEAVRGSLHELGVAEAQALLPAGSVEARRLPPAWYPGAWGRLLEEVAGAPEWLAAHGATEEQAQGEARAAAGRRLLRARDAAARVLAALSAQDPVAGAALAARAYGVPVEPGEVLPWAVNPDPLLQSAEALRVELLAAQAEVRLQQEAGAAREWWQAAAAGALLQALWREGAPSAPAALSARLGARSLDAAALAQRVRLRAGI
ncbi:MAG: hypothetical protein QM767_25655 [Anaeromyxobacter sp.]